MRGTESLEPKRSYGELLPIERKLMEDAVFVTAWRLLSDYRNDIPDLIVPETSGRLAEKFLLPILSLAADVRGVNRPKSYRIKNISPRDKLYAKACEIEQIYNLPGDEILRRHMSNSLPAPKDSDSLNSLYYAGRLRQDELSRAQDIIRERAQEGRINDLIIIDDVVETGKTRKQIANSFGESKIPLYALFSYIPERHKEDPDIVFGSGHDTRDIPYFYSGETHLIRGAQKKYKPWGIIIKDIKPYNPTEEGFLERIQQEIILINTNVLERLHFLGIV